MPLLRKPEHPVLDRRLAINQDLFFDMPFYEGGGNLFHDIASGAVGVPTTPGVPSWIAGGSPFGHAVKFTSGGNDRIIVSDGGRMQKIMNLTIQALVRADSVDGGTIVAKQPYAAITAGPYFELRQDGSSNSWACDFDWGNNPGWGSTGGSRVAAKWQNIIMSLGRLDNIAAVPDFMIDGVISNTYAFSVAPTGSFVADTGTMSVGNGDATGTFGGEGGLSIAAIRIWGRVLSRKEKYWLTKNPFGIYRNTNLFPIPVNSLNTNFTKSLNDSITLTESLKRATSKQVSMAVSLNENLKRFTSKTLTASITPSETLTKSHGQYKTLNDSVTLHESLKRATSKKLTMSVTLTETLTKVGAFFRKFTESVTLTETLKRFTSKKLSMSLTLNETLTKVSGKAKLLTDSITLNEKLSRSTGKKLTASITLNESLKRATAKTLTAIVTLIETLTKHAQFFRSLNDSITLHETLKRATSKKFTMSISLTEVLNRFMGRKITDSITLHEFLKKSTSRLLTASVTLIDRLAKNTQKKIVNTITLNEKLNRFMTRTIKDSVTLNEFFSRSASFYRSFHDSISLTDRLRKFTNRNVKDNVTLNESLKKDITKSFFESISLREFFSKIAHTARPYVASTYSFLSGKRTSDQFTEKRNTTVLSDKQNSERVFFKKDTTVLRTKRDSVE